MSDKDLNVRQKITPPELARRWGVAPEKVLTWIRSGELRAIDACARRGQRARYLIDLADVAEFESRRSTLPTPRRVSRPRRRRQNVVEFF